MPPNRLRYLLGPGYQVVRVLLVDLPNLRAEIINQHNQTRWISLLVLPGRDVPVEGEKWVISPTLGAWFFAGIACQTGTPWNPQSLADRYDLDVEGLVTRLNDLEARIAALEA